MLWVTPGKFDAVFVLSAIFGVIGAAVIWLFAQEKPQTAPTQTAPTQREASQRDSAVSPRERSRRPAFVDQWKQVVATPGVRRLASAVGLLSLVTVGDSFIYLVILSTSDMSARYFPLLFVGTALVYLVLAVPLGRLADRVGTRRSLREPRPPVLGNVVRGQQSLLCHRVLWRAS